MMVDSYEDDLFSFANLTRYPGILHSLVFAGQTFHDLSLGPSLGTKARLHLSKAIYHLQKSLDNPTEATQYTTCATIMSLAVAFLIAGDIETTGKHLDGLRKILNLRGGMKSLGSGSIIEYKARG